MVVGKFLDGSDTLRLSNKNFYGWSIYVVSFTFRVCPDVYFAEDVPDNDFYLDGDFLCNPLLELLNLDVELKLDLTVLPWWPIPFILTVLPKSGISKFLS